MASITVGEHTILFDDADAELVSSRRWGVEARGGLLYARATSRPRVYMHRLICAPQAGQRTDHKNGNTLDNRRDNLRPCDAAQNGWNSGVRRRRFKGIHPHSGGYRAEVRCRGTRVYAGWAKTEEAAARLYDAKAKALHGAFARLNFEDGA